MKYTLASPITVFPDPQQISTIESKLKRYTDKRRSRSTEPVARIVSGRLENCRALDRPGDRNQESHKATIRR